MNKEFSANEKKKFDRIKKLVMDVVSSLDNNKGYNIERYKNMFNIFENNPDEFRKWEVLHGDELDNTIQIFALPFEEPRMPQIKKAADILGISLEDYMYYRQNDPKGTRTRMKVPTGYIHIKRVQQLLSKKNHYTFTNEERSLKTGDVKGEHSKVAGISEPEIYALMAAGAERSLEELLGPRGDNQEKKREMYRQIATLGYCSLDKMTSTRTSSTTLNTLNTYLIGAGIRSDLITNTLETEYTLNKNLKK